MAGLASMVLLGMLVRGANIPTGETAPTAGLLPLVTPRGSPDITGGCSQGPTNPPSSSMHNLDNYASDWGVYCEGSPTWIKENTSLPSIDGESLRCSITGGASYSNVHCYQNLLSDPTASTFTLTSSFWISPTTTCNNQTTPSIVQGLEFSISKWYQSMRYELALQWQNVGSGAPQWRYWDPHQSQPWVAVNPALTQCLKAGQWHTIKLEGEIVNDQVHYTSFMIDQDAYVMDITVPPISAPGEIDRLAVAIQLDGSSTQSPYDVYIDRVSFIRKSLFQVYIPLVMK